MLDTTHSSVPYLLQLSRELRDDIVFRVFFSGHRFKYLRGSSRKSLVTAYPNQNLQRAHCDAPVVDSLDASLDPHIYFDVSILQTCRQLQQEGEDILNANLEFDLRARLPTYRLMFLESINSSHLRRIRHLRLPVFVSEPLCGLKNIILLISRGCGSLQTLEFFMESQTLDALSVDAEWIQALNGFRCSVVISTEETQQVQSLQLGSAIEAKLNDEICAETKHLTPSADLRFPFLQLPGTIQRRIIRYVMLPESLVIHPCLARATDRDSSNILPLFLTCRAISRLAEQVLYEEAIFSNCDGLSERKFKEFLKRRTSRQRTLMKKFFSRDLDHWIDRDFDKLLRSNCPGMEDLEKTCILTGWVHPCFRWILPKDEAA